jgi:hypothetical protein
VPAVVATGAALVVAAASWATPTQFRLVFHGAHTGALLHYGAFESSAFCSSGQAADFTTVGEAGIRRFTCADGRGTFDARISPLPAEHRGTGTWQIVAGTGELAKLRGRGMFASELLSGDLANPPTITFRSTWQGVVALDDTPPTITFTRLTAQKLRRPARTHLLRVVFTANDGAGDVAYTTTVLAGSASHTRFGTTRGGVSLSFRILAPSRLRTVQVRVRANDPLGNERAVTRVVRLPRR